MAGLGMDDFTPKAREVLSLARKEAERLRKPLISTEHLLIALIQMEGSVASRVLRELGLEADQVVDIVETEIGFGDHIGQVELSPGIQQVIPYAFEEVRKRENKAVGTEHLLLGLIRLSNCEAMNILGKLGITPEPVHLSRR